MLGISSCVGRVKVVDLRHEAFNRYGRVKDYDYDLSKKKVITWWDLNGMWGDFFYEPYPGVRLSPEGRIDSTILANPDWEFIFYVTPRTPRDTFYIMKALDSTKCNITVMVDYDSLYLKTNNLKSNHADGLILTAKGKHLGFGKVNNPAFDFAFKKAKERAGIFE